MIFECWGSSCLFVSLSFPRMSVELVVFVKFLLNDLFVKRLLDFLVLAVGLFEIIFSNGCG